MEEPKINAHKIVWLGDAWHGLIFGERVGSGFFGTIYGKRTTDEMKGLQPKLREVVQNRSSILLDNFLSRRVGENVFRGKNVILEPPHAEALLNSITCHLKLLEDGKAQKDDGNEFFDAC